MPNMTEEQVQEMQEYVRLSEGVRAGLVEKVASLENQLALTEKTASAALDQNKVNATLDRLIAAEFLEASDKEAAFSEIERNPSTLLHFLDKLAEQEKERNSLVPSLGSVREDVRRPVTTPSDSRRESDRAYEAGVSSLLNRM
jgi:hypothetical protein